jgi:hypothetical protein
MIRDRRKIADLYLQGETQVDIGEELSLSQATISRDLKALQKEWLESTLIDFDKAKAEQLAKVDRLEREYWTAWEHSCEDAETATHKVKGKIEKRQDEDGKFIAEQPAEVAKTSKGQAGDPRFLAGIQWCIERRCKILGLNAPERTEVTGAVVVQYTGNVNPDDL